MNITILEMEKCHLLKLWEILQTYPNYFDDTMGIKTFSDFHKWYKEKVVDGLVGINKETDEIIGCTYIDEIDNNNGRVNVFMKHKVIPFIEMIELFKKYLNFFIDKHKLKMLYGVIRVENKACLLLLKCLNFKIIPEVLVAYEYVNNKPINCLISTYIPLLKQME